MHQTLFCLKNYTYTQDLRQGDLLLEYHSETLQSSPAFVNTELSEVEGILSFNLSGQVALDTLGGPPDANGQITVQTTVTGSEIKFFLIGRSVPKEVT